jgi:hypothetical protein
MNGSNVLLMHDNKTVAYRQKDAVAPNHCRPKHALKVHLWGGISKCGATKLFAFDGIMCADFYTHEILSNTLLPFIRKVSKTYYSFLLRQSKWFISSSPMLLNEGGFVDTVVTGLGFPIRCSSMTYLIIIWIIAII